MENNSEEPVEFQAQTDIEIQEGEETYLTKEEEKLFKIAIWSDYLSKGFVVITILLSAGRIIDLFQQAIFSNMEELFGWFISLASELNSWLLAGFVYLILQAVSEGIYVLVDIKDMVVELDDLELGAIVSDE